MKSGRVAPPGPSVSDPWADPPGDAGAAPHEEAGGGDVLVEG